MIIVMADKLTCKDEKSMWTFETSAALDVFNSMLKTENVKLYSNYRLNRTSGVELMNNRSVSISIESGLKISGKQCIAVTYEGNSLNSADISYTLGRESTN